MNRTISIGVALAAATSIAAATTTAWASAPRSAVGARSTAPAYSCAYDRAGTINQFSQVRNSPDGTVIGNAYKGDPVEFCGSSGVYTGGTTWVYGTADNHTGWINEAHISNIHRIP